LTGILSWELEAIGSATVKGECIVDKIYILGCPLLIILDETIVEMSTGEIVGTVIIET